MTKGNFTSPTTRRYSCNFTSSNKPASSSRADPYLLLNTGASGSGFLRCTGWSCPCPRPGALGWSGWWACGTFDAWARPWQSGTLPPCCPTTLPWAPAE